jgi:tetratricopeptide (TPR) repeat protein
VSTASESPDSQRSRGWRRLVAALNALCALRCLSAAAVLIVSVAGCTPQAALLLALVPEGTFETVLANMQGVSDPNRAKLETLEKQGDWKGIAEFAEDNITREPRDPDWWVVAGYAYSRLGEHGRAAERFQEAVRLSPDDIIGWNLLAQEQRSMGQPERAIRTLDSALRVSRDSPVTYYLLGETFSDLKRPSRAVEFYLQAIERDPQFVEAIYALGLAYARLGRKTDFDDALKHLHSLNPAAAKQLASAAEAIR